MTPEEQINQIIGHLSELQDATLELQNNINNLSDVHMNMKESDSGIHEDITNQIGDMHSILSQKMSHTEQMVTNLLHPDTMDQITNFINVMNDAMNFKPHTEE